jgi:hypothetical protein
LTVLSQIIGVNEASESWGLTRGQVIYLCEIGEIEAVRIEKIWIVKKDQPPPNSHLLNPPKLDGLPQLLELLDQHPKKPLRYFFSYPDEILNQSIENLPRIAKHFNESNTRRSINSIITSINKVRPKERKGNPVTIRDFLSRRQDVVKRYKNLGKKAYDDLITILLCIQLKNRKGQ